MKKMNTAFKYPFQHALTLILVAALVVACSSDQTDDATNTGKATATTPGDHHKNWGESEEDQLYREQQKARTTGNRTPVEFED